MANTSISISSIVITSIISVSAAVSSISATAAYPDASIGVSVSGQTINASYFIVPGINLPEQQVTASDGEDEISIEAKLTKVIDAAKTDEALPSEAIDQFDVEIVKTDSVTMVESRVKVFTDFIDFDPSDDDIDPTPVTVSEAAAFDLSKNFSGADDVSPSESISKEPNKSPSDSVTTSEAINQFRPQKNVTDTATASEAVDRFDVTTVLDDTVTVTESTAKEITPAGKTDSVSAVQSNVKTFTSNIDFDLSDADVDPDPVTATDVISEFDFNKGLTDTSSITESTAKNFTHGGLSDTASPTESTAFDVTKPAIADTLSAIEGIKLEPTVQFTPATSGAQTFVITVVSSGGNKFAIDGVTNPVLELASGVTYTFDVSDSSNSGHPLRFKDGSTSYTDGVTVSGTAGQSGATVTFVVPNDAPASTLLYYCTVHGNAMGNSISVPNSLTANQVLAVESAVLNIQPAFSHTASVTESINTTLTLGESDYVYPDFVTASDGTETGKVRGYHIGTNRVRITTSPVYSYQMNDEFGMLNESRIFGESLDGVQRYNVIFIQDRFRFRIVDTEAVVGDSDSLLNSAPIAAAANDSIARRSFTGVLGAAELLNEGIVNSDTITYTDTTNAGLLVNFIYTDTDDTELGGHFLNETPLCAGAII